MSAQEEEDDYSGLDPRGQHREGVISRDGSPFRRSSNFLGRDQTAETDIAPPPEGAYEDFEEFYIEFPFVQAALKIFDENVVEPGWDIEARIDGEVDDEMTQALQMWGENCAVYAGEPGHDLGHILAQIPSLRRVKPAVFLEKIGTVDEPDSLAAIQMLDPTTITIRLRKNQNIVVQPGDDVGQGHPTTAAGEPAGFVQYDNEAERSMSRHQDNEPIFFSADDIIKVVYDPKEGSPWGRTIWPALKDIIRGMKRKVADRNAAIRLAGHPHRIYSSDTWTEDEAKSYSEAHKEGSTSKWELDEERTSDGYASRVDFVPSMVDVQVVEGQVADIEDAIRDDIEAIFSMLPVSKFKIAYEKDINQFVVEPQSKKDDMWIDKERRFLESLVGKPLFRQKADELADGYDGTIDFKIKQPVSDNPLERDSFDAEEFLTFMRAFNEYSSSEAHLDFPRALPYFAAGMDRDRFVEEYGGVEEIGELEEDENTELQAKALGLSGTTVDMSEAEDNGEDKQ